MKHWFKDQQLRSLLKNTSYLGMSRAVAAVCGIATIALAGRGLGLLLLGTLILITSYTKAASGIVAMVKLAALTTKVTDVVCTKLPLVALIVKG